MVKNPWCDFVTDNGFHRRPADVNLSSAVVGSIIDGFGTNLRLKNWRHRLSLVFQTTFDPADCGVLSAGICTIVIRTSLLSYISSQRNESVKPATACFAAQ
jgi:hypothetical protein